MNHFVEIVRFHDGGIEEKMGPMSERRAEKVDSGLNINLNHRDFYTRIVDESEHASRNGQKPEDY